jgi:hypothetical protein
MNLLLAKPVVSFQTMRHHDGPQFSTRTSDPAGIAPITSKLMPGPLRRLRLSVSVAAETALAESSRAPTANENACFCMSHLSSYRPRNKSDVSQLYAQPLAKPDHILVTHCHKRARMSYLVIKCLLPHRLS